MERARSRIGLGLFAIAALAVSACGGGGHGAASGASVLPAANTASSSTLTVQGRHGRRVRVDVVSRLKMTVDASGNADFSLQHKWAWGSIYRSSKAVTAPIPAFSLTCNGNDGDDGHGRDRRSQDMRWGGWGWHDGHGPQNDRCRIFGDNDDGANFYVREVSTNDKDGDGGRWLDWDDGFTKSIVAGAGTLSSDGKSVTFPAANAPLSLAANTAYVFELVRTSAVLATPSPTPSPTPTPVSDPCPAFSSFGGSLVPPKVMPAPVAGNASDLTFDYLSVNGNVENLACGMDGKMYFPTYPNGHTYQFDPATGNVTQWSTAAGFSITRGGDGLMYEQGNFAGSKGASIAQFSADGSTQKLFPGGYNGFLITGPDGNIYTFNGSSVIQLSTATGTETPFAAPANCGSPAFDAVTSGPKGMLWFHGPSCGLVAMTTSGTFTAVAPGFTDTVAHLAVGPDGAIYATDVTTPAIVRIDPNSGAILKWMLPSTYQPNGLVAGPSSLVWFDGSDSSTGSDKIDALDLVSGTLTDFDQGGANNSSGFYTYGPDHNIYTISVGSDAIVKIPGTTSL